MSARKDPWHDPAWHALNNEAALVRQLLGSGVTALGKASYADKKGEYYTAFFNLSIGLERLAKLILVADFALSNSGRLPQPKTISAFGHKLSDLMDEAEAIVQKRNLKLE